MGILGKLFGRSSNKTDMHEICNVSPPLKTLSVQPQHIISVQTQNAICISPDLSAHPDLHDLLWWIDGPDKNYSPTKSIARISVNDIIMEISMTGLQEPSLLSVNAPVNVDVNPTNVDRLPYYPDYSRLSPEQKGVYWQFLHSPYSGSFEIGYVFILYYGLERHLLKGDYEKAFHAILKLRDVYSNGSFQSYSGCAIIVACMVHNRIDLLNEFFASLDKDYELKFPANLYLLGKYGLGIPLYAQDIMRMAKDFEFTNLNYIKKYPDMFELVLREQIQSRYGLIQLDIHSFVGSSEMKKAYKVDVLTFANISIESRTIPVPQIIDIFKFKKAVNDLLEATHDAVKANVALQRKEGNLPTAKVMTNSSPKKILNFDTDMETTLLGQYRSAGSDPVEKHFSMMCLQDFYYKYRNLDDKYLAACVRFCEEDLSNLEQFSTKWRTKNGNNPVQIPAFQRMAIIYEKGKAYTPAIAICDQAIAFYQNNGLFDLVNEFEGRKKKLHLAVQKG
jgi:hypothetical protein